MPRNQFDSMEYTNVKDVCRLAGPWGAQYGGGAALCVNGTFICFVLLLAKANIPHGEPWCPTSSKCSRLRHSGVTKRCSSWACIGNPNPEQETSKGTHAQETSANQRRPTTQHAAQGSNPPIGALYLSLIHISEPTRPY